MEKVVEKKSISANSKTKQIALDAMFVALTLVFTALVNIQVPSFGGAGGLIHLGNVPLLIAAMIYGKRTGALAGGLGIKWMGSVGTMYNHNERVNRICSRCNL